VPGGWRGGLAAGALAALVLSAGCAAVPGADSATVRIVTTPELATALADGRRLGVTPLTVVRDDAFPPRWHNMEYRVSGTLTLRKAGCRPVQMPVSDSVLSKPVHVRLHCQAGGASQTAPSDSAGASDAGGNETAAPASQGAGTGSVAQRLQRLRRLHDQGLISDGEYQHIRQRILDSL